MSQTTLQFSMSGDTPVSVVLSDAGATYGIKRNDTNAVVVAAGVAMTPGPAGTWTYTFTDPAAGLTYTYSIKFTFADGSVGYDSGIKVGASAVADTLPRYVLLAEALGLAGLCLNIPAWTAATSQNQNLALAAATMDIESGRWQGRKYDQAQSLHFPAVAYESGARPSLWFDNSGQQTAPGVPPTGSIIWDWDAVNAVAIVPTSVKLATIYQANSRLDGSRGKALDNFYKGLSGQTTGRLSESYDIKTVLAATGGTLALCREAADLMRNYHIQAGRLL